MSKVFLSTEYCHKLDWSIDRQLQELCVQGQYKLKKSADDYDVSSFENTSGERRGKFIVLYVLYSWKSSQLKCSIDNNFL